jgi:hypothetical protein
MLQRKSEGLNYLGGEQVGHFLASIAAARGCISIIVDYNDDTNLERGVWYVSCSDMSVK